MSSSEPETPEYEKLQAEFALHQFNEGADIKAGIAAESYGDARYDPSGKLESAGSGIAAQEQKAAFEASRLQNDVQYAGDSFDKTSVDNAAVAAEGGIDTGEVSSDVNKGVSDISDISSIMSKSDSQKALNDMYESNSKKQAAFDIALGAGTAYAHGNLETETDPQANSSQVKPDYEGVYDMSSTSPSRYA